MPPSCFRKDEQVQTEAPLIHRRTTIGMMDRHGICEEDAWIENQYPTEDDRELLLLKAKRRHELGRIEYAQSRYDDALLCFRDVLKVYRTHGHRRGEGEVLGSLGNLYRVQGALLKAASCFRVAISIFGELGNKRAEGNQVGNLGNIYREQGHLDQAVECYGRAIDIAREIGNSRSEGIFLGNIGLIYRVQGQNERAAEYHRQALEIHKIVEDRRFEGIHLGNLGEALLGLGRLDEAETALRAAISINDETYPVAAGAFRGVFALLLARRGLHKEVHRLLKVGEDLVVSHPEEHARFLCTAGEAHLLSGDVELAYAMLNRARELAASLKIGEHSALRRALFFLNDLLLQD